MYVATNSSLFSSFEVSEVDAARCRAGLGSEERSRLGRRSAQQQAPRSPWAAATYGAGQRSPPATIHKASAIGQGKQQVGCWFSALLCRSPAICRHQMHALFQELCDATLRGKRARFGSCTWRRLPWISANGVRQWAAGWLVRWLTVKALIRRVGTQFTVVF